MSDDPLQLDPQGWEWGTNIPRSDNPYLDEVMRTVEETHLVIRDNEIDLGFSGERDPNWVFALGDVFGDNSIRKKYSYAIPTEPVLSWLVKLGPIVEVGAGKGYWAKMIADRGGDIVAYDVIDPRQNGMTDMGEPWYDIAISDCEVCGDHPGRTLFLCWPPLGSNMASRALMSYINGGGRYVVYIGAAAGGCTAGDSFFDILDARTADISPQGLDVLSWWGVHDHLYFYRIN